MPAFDLGDLGRFVGQSNKLPMGAGAYAGKNSLTTTALPHLLGLMSRANPNRRADGVQARDMIGRAGGSDLSSVVVPPIASQPVKAASAPLAGLADAIKSSTERATSRAVQQTVAPVLDQRRREMKDVPARPALAGRTGSPADRPVQTLTRLVRGAY